MYMIIPYIPLEDLWRYAHYSSDFHYFLSPLLNLGWYILVFAILVCWCLVVTFPHLPITKDLPHEVQLKLLKWMFIFILILLSAYAINVILYFIDYYLCMNFIDIWMGIHQYDGTLDAYYAMPEIQEKDIEIAELKEKIRYHEERLLTHPHEKYVYTVNGVEYQSEYTRAEIAEMHGLNKKI